MSGSPSNHEKEGENERRHHGDSSARLSAAETQPPLDVTLPPRSLATPRALRPLSEAILRAHNEPMFLATLARLLKQGGASAPAMLWGTVQDILSSGHSERAVIAWDLASELCQHAKKKSSRETFSPPAKTVAELIAVSPYGAWAAFKGLSGYYPLDPLEVAQAIRTTTQSSESLKGFGFACVKESYSELVQREANLPRIAGILKNAVVRRDPKSLEACLFIRDKYESCRGWTGREAETTMLWRLRDELTALLLRAPVSCEANLKISLLYPREVPHPAMNGNPQPILATERWILEQARFLSEAVGIDHATNIPRIDEKGGLDSSHFMYLGSIPDVRFRGIQTVISRFDRDRHVLLPLARSLRVEVPGLWEGEQCRQHPKEPAPRTWIDKDDEDRYEALQVTLACRCVAAHYWKPEVSERMRQGAHDLLRAVIRERPYHLALAAPGLRKWHGEFYRDVSRLARDEALNVWRRTPEASGSHHDVRSAIVLLDAFGSAGVEVHRLAFDGLTIALERPNASLMNERHFADFIGAMRPSCLTSPLFEERGSAAIVRFPNSLCAAQLARNLSEVRCSDADAGAVIARQSCRRDLEPRVWLNYAHSALVGGADSATRQRIQRVFEERYDRSVRMLARWNTKARASYRMLVGSLYPERVGQISSLRYAESNLFQSSLEARTKAVIAGVPGISVEGGKYIPWAPAIDGVLRSEDTSIPPVVLLVDGEPYHSVNGQWPFRGFDGHTILATKILTAAGYPVLRISGQLGEASERATLRSTVLAALEHLGNQASVSESRLVIDPPDDYTDIAGKALLYRPSAPHRHGSSVVDMAVVAHLLDSLAESEVEDEGTTESD